MVKELKMEKDLIKAKEVPIKCYNYSYIKDILNQKNNYPLAHSNIGKILNISVRYIFNLIEIFVKNKIGSNSNYSLSYNKQLRDYLLFNPHRVEEYSRCRVKNKIVYSCTKD